MLNPIHCIPASLCPFPSRTQVSFPGVSIHSLHFLSTTYLTPTAIWLFSCHSTGIALAKFTNNFPDPLDMCLSSAYLTTAVSDSINPFLPWLSCCCSTSVSFPSFSSSLLSFPRRLLFLNDCHILELGCVHVAGGASSAFSLSLVRLPTFMAPTAHSTTEFQTDPSPQVCPTPYSTYLTACQGSPLG